MVVNVSAAKGGRIKLRDQPSFRMHPLHPPSGIQWRKFEHHHGMPTNKVLRCSFCFTVDKRHEIRHSSIKDSHLTTHVKPVLLLISLAMHTCSYIQKGSSYQLPVTQADGRKTSEVRKLRASEQLGVETIRTARYGCFKIWDPEKIWRKT